MRAFDPKKAIVNIQLIGDRALDPQANREPNSGLSGSIEFE